MFIRIATSDDIPAAGAVAAAAYIDDAQDAFMFPGRKAYPARYLKTKESIIRHGLEDPTGTTIVTVLDENDEKWQGKPEIVGFCIWYRDPEPGTEDNKKDDDEENQSWFSQIKSAIVDSELVQYTTDLLDPLVSAPNAATMARTCQLPNSKRYFSPEPKSACYGIMDIAVHPDHQGHGIARRMVEWGMKKAKEEGIPIELSATPAGSVLYKKLGFEKVGVWRWKPGMEGPDDNGGWDIMRWQAEVPPTSADE